MIKNSTAIKAQTKARIYTATNAGHRLISGKVVRSDTGSTTVSRQPIIETDPGILPDDCDMAQAKATLAGYIIAGEATAEEVEALVVLYPAWEPGVEYLKDTLLSHSGKLYKVNQDHTSQEIYPPDAEGVTALYSEAAPEGVIPLWVHSTGAHDAYAVGDMVQYKEKIWQSKIDANTTVPDGDEPYNRYWEDLGAI